MVGGLKSIPNRLSPIKVLLVISAFRVLVPIITPVMGFRSELFPRKIFVVIVRLDIMCSSGTLSAGRAYTHDRT